MAAADQSPAGPMPEPALLALARKNFGALSRAEEKLFRAAQEGSAASAFPGDANENKPANAANWDADRVVGAASPCSGDAKEADPANAANWDADRVVRAACISWVCTDPRALALMTYRGLELQGMRIDGELYLSNAEIRFLFSARRCAFSEDIYLQDAQLRGFYLMGCQIKGLNAERAVINGSLILDDGFTATSEVCLVGIRIGGDLACTGATFSNPNGLALMAAGAQIEGHVFLRSFIAKGTVNLVAIRIGGGLDCDGAQFINPKGYALNANTAKIESAVYFRGGFKAEGEINLVGTKTANLQICDAIEADELILDLRLTQVETFWDDEGSWPDAKNLRIDGFRYERLYEEAPFEAASRKKWLSLQPRDRFRPQPYEQLASVLRQMGHERDARQVTIAKNHARAGFTHFPHQSWWWYNVFGRLIGYGYAPWRAFAMSLAMILLGTLLFHVGSTHGLISPTSEKAYVKANGQVIEENGPKKISGEYPVFHALVYSVESFTPLLKLDQTSNWTPNANRHTEISTFCRQALISRQVPFSGNFLRYYLYFHIASGWLLTSLWVGAITGLVKT